MPRVLRAQTETFALTTTKTTLITCAAGERLVVTGVEFKNISGAAGDFALGTLYRTDASNSDAETLLSPKELRIDKQDGRIGRASTLYVNAGDTIKGEASADSFLQVDISYYVEDVS